MPTLTTDEQICSQCGVKKPGDEYYVRNKGTGRRFSRCRACHAEKTKKWQQGHRALLAERERQRRLADPEAARRKDAAFRERHREELRKRSRERERRPDVIAKRTQYRAEHADERRAYNDRYRAEHEAERQAYNLQYYQDNAAVIGDRIRASIAKKPDKYRQIHSDWKKANKDAVNASTHRRRARELHNGGSWRQDDWQRLKAQCDWRCLMCGKQEVTDGIRLCFDHIVPLSVGGFNIISNGQPLCRSCNSLKHRKVLDLRPDFLRL